MVVFGNMQVLSFLSCFLNSLRYQDGYYGVEEANDTIMAGVQCLNAFLLAPK